MVYHSCCVPGCYDQTSTRHRFPNPTKAEIRFKEWVRLVGNEKLLQIDPGKIFRNYRVCHEHFRPEDKSTNNFLKKTTLPSRNLPHIKKAQASTSCTAETDLQQEEVIPSTSKTFHPDEIVFQQSSTDCKYYIHNVFHFLENVDLF
ncbi:uncharacterized protein LOC113464407 [Ceratina calcarata]|uniref:Uncharacterized protein LOC113464407 n=1 Tax=Ceratina calcarata TaxID=156304 RepID=A0AAJ7WB11_9HYME|nr:uncharacterized protein LOC113464407 [Ceratina calcarata]